MCGSFLGQSVVITCLMEKGGEITSNFPFLLPVEVTCGIWQLEEGGDDSFLFQLRVKEQSFVTPASLLWSRSLLLGLSEDTAEKAQGTEVCKENSLYVKVEE